MAAITSVAAVCQSRTARYGLVESGLGMKRGGMRAPADEPDQTAKQSP
jgi:hypothetical protein